MPHRLAQDLPVSRIVAAHVHALRTERGWSLRELARQAAATDKPVGFNSIRRMEKGRDPQHRAVAVIVDDVVALAALFGVRPEQLLTAPDCFACMDRPPTGFSCRACGAAS